MKQNFKSGTLILYMNLLAAIIFSSSCVKDYRDGETNFSGVQPTVIIAEGGLSGTSFGNAAVTFPGTDTSDIANFHVNYAATNVAPADEVVGLAVDSDAIANYNRDSLGLQYELMPDSDYSFTATSVTVPKGNNYTAAIPVTFYPDKIDASKNYMLPISITSVPSGTMMSNNQNTIYYHAIGNPIAGSYGELWTRWNASDTTGAPTYDHLDVGPVTFSPVDATTIAVQSGGTGETSYISFTNNNGTLSDFTVAFDDSQIASLGITVTTGPFLLLADPISGAYNVYFEYNNSSGLHRCILDEYKKL
jgi:hypothetical protein